MLSVLGMTYDATGDAGLDEDEAVLMDGCSVASSARRSIAALAPEERLRFKEEGCWRFVGSGCEGELDDDDDAARDLALGAS